MEGEEWMLLVSSSLLCPNPPCEPATTVALTRFLAWMFAWTSKYPAVCKRMLWIYEENGASATMLQPGDIVKRGTDMKQHRRFGKRHFCRHYSAPSSTPTILRTGLKHTVSWTPSQTRRANCGSYKRRRLCS